ncbi:hypothetical protein Dform_01130 [Dehalogenimonas formicexedens]|uniref:DUF4365 domain-containing protein n=1 Tax=Dehalogenimonas formicexedens TaxID=1839801 RepID=A0A1P8F7L6_9CHLR|nr:hypothetical protein [Dehalogenimonas formicexedens]APV44464.1 hypothetical protein Dform_01130 [Dehalogenimonas formicexedens]
MTSRLKVSEKTLELNISAEILQMVRSWPGCACAFWVGMKQDQEAKNGIDELIQNVPRGFHLALQFKAPKATPPNQIPYRYTINDRQNGNLLRLAINRPNAVYYVFPMYNTFQKLRNNSPNLLQDTWALQVAATKSLQKAGNSQGRHEVYASTNPPGVIIYSNPFPADLSRFSTIHGNVFESPSEYLLSHTALKDWLTELVSGNRVNRQSVGQLLRGFSTVCVPI